jgi:hypothetical protein
LNRPTSYKTFWRDSRKQPICPRQLAGGMT